MSELEEWQNNSPAQTSGNDEGRDGHRAFNNNSGQRPRFNAGNGASPERQRRPRFTSSSERAYSSNDEGGFRPEGFSRPQRTQGGYNNYNAGQQRQNGYGQQRQGGYQPRQGGYQQRQGGYQPRQNGYNNYGGGYGNPQQRPSFSNQHSTYVHGYRPGQQNGEGDYNFQGGYQPRQGGYNNQRGGYGNQRQGGYGNQRPQNPNARMRPNFGKKQITYQEYIEDPNAPIRLNKYLANAGVCSRREADQMIQAGVVKVNGVVVTELGSKVNRTDEVHFHDQLVSLERKVYVILNKPKDYVTTSDDPQQRKTVMELVKNACRERIYPVGRLDRNTTGVLLFTNDGELASKLTHPKFLKKKIYHVYLDKNVTAADLKQIAEGVTLEDGEVHADAISYATDTDKKQVGIEIHSGKNRIVRRIFESLGYRVLKLDRVMFAGLTKKGLKRGDWRFLTEQEVAYLHMNSYE